MGFAIKVGSCHPAELRIRSPVLSRNIAILVRSVRLLVLYCGDIVVPINRDYAGKAYVMTCNAFLHFILELQWIHAENTAHPPGGSYAHRC